MSARGQSSYHRRLGCSVFSCQSSTSSGFYQVAVLNDTIRKDIEGVAGEVAASAAGESLKLAAELVNKEERISQLGARIQELQVFFFWLRYICFVLYCKIDVW